jgi:hypothetical protein
MPIRSSLMARRNLQNSNTNTTQEWLKQIIVYKLRKM